jgi:hypothetical protein
LENLSLSLPGCAAMAQLPGARYSCVQAAVPMATSYRRAALQTQSKACWQLATAATCAWDATVP